jgi:hypothetical protein
VKGDQLSHVYGAHYDMDEVLPGHPVFHSQMTSQMSYLSTITDLFHQSYAKCDDLAAGLLANVRTPTAQMDAFSVITQIGADHLLSERSAVEVLTAFQTLRAACDFFVGAGGRLPYLNAEGPSRCYRSTHWYERTTADIA